MDYVKAQEDLIAAMESWRDVTMAPDDPNQPHTFQQAQQQYNFIQDYLKNQQQQKEYEARDPGFLDPFIANI